MNANSGNFAEEQEIAPPESAVPLVMVVVPFVPVNRWFSGNIGLTYATQRQGAIACIFSLDAVPRI